MLDMSRRTWLVAPFVLALIAVAGFAQNSGQSMVGTWKLDVSKSSFKGTADGMTVPVFEQLVVTTDEPGALKWELAGAGADGVSWTTSYDGPVDRQYHRLVRADGDRTIAYTRVPGGLTWGEKDGRGKVFRTGSNRLSADGNTLTIKGAMKQGNGAAEFVSVFTRVK
jgi:hypothetical protein